jgi:hypothetical protein
MWREEQKTLVAVQRGAIIVALAAITAVMPAPAAPDTAAIQTGTLIMTGSGVNTTVVTLQAASALTMTGSGVNSRVVTIQAASALAMTGVGGSGAHSATTTVQAGTLIMTGSP